MVSVGQNPLTFILAILAWVAHLDPWEGNILPQWPEFEGDRACKGAFLALSFGGKAPAISGDAVMLGIGGISIEACF